ncbi:MAG: TIGR00341 family protein [Patescibacteria group bacterium]|nr:TIGR00341 family protein [Patescibacteria group bacterium]MBU2508969.1 TIGR00341 family protein [Patescibacteria group bacterium]
MQNWKILFIIDDKHRKDLIDRLFEESKPSPGFYLLICLASIIAAVGLIQNNAPVVIGAMLVAPLLAPVLTLGSSIVTGRLEVVARSIKGVLKMMAVVLVVGVVVSLFVGRAPDTSALLVRTQPHLEDFFVALAAGIAAAFAYARPNMSPTLPGIAVSVSLLPPIVNAGILFADGQERAGLGAFGLFGINLIGIIFASIVIFSLMNLYRARGEAVKVIQREEKDAKDEKRV